MDYENISDEEVCRLLKQAAPHVKIGEITDSNRELVVPFLRVLLWMITWDDNIGLPVASINAALSDISSSGRRRTCP